MNTKPLEIGITPKFVEQFKEFHSRFSSYIKLIHFSHSDLDGIGCAVIRRLVMHAINSKSANAPVYFVKTPSKINDTIMNTVEQLVTKSQEYSNAKIIRILVTDISAVDPMLVNKLSVKFGGKYQFDLMVVDHHVHTEDELRTCDIMNSNPKFRSNFYYTTQNSATYMMYELMNLVIPKGSFIETRMNSIQKFAEDVSRYDTGHWGEWSAANFDTTSKKKLADEVRLQLIFEELREYYESINPPTKPSSIALRNIANLFARIIYIENRSPIDIRYGDRLKDKVTVYRPDRKGDRVGQTFLDRLHMEYDKFGKNNFSISYFIQNGELKPEMLLKSFAASLEHESAVNHTRIYHQIERNELSFFSLISRRYFEEHSNVSVLAVWNDSRKSVELRSNGDVDVSAIARTFGGGGHVKASGFPINE